jgi:hypothetical protein
MLLALSRRSTRVTDREAGSPDSSPQCDVRTVERLGSDVGLIIWKTFMMTKGSIPRRGAREGLLKDRQEADTTMCRSIKVLPPRKLQATS